jgi:probable phosphoglycerate mutase
MELILVRHGLPLHSTETSNPPLSPAGREQSRLVAQALSAERVDAVFSSTMIRAVQTAEPFAALADLPIQQRDGICEFDRGTGSYVPMEQLKRENYPAWKAFVDGGLNVDIGAFQKEVVETLDAVIKSHAAKRVVVFCHGGVVNVWAAHVLGMPPRLFFEPDYTSVHRFLCASAGQRNLVSLNERAHLKAMAPA